MKSLGKVVSISEKKLVLKTGRTVRIGSKVFDEHGNFVGSVVDFFGPTKGPYVLVSPKKEADPYLGRELFG